MAVPPVVDGADQLTVIEEDEELVDEIDGAVGSKKYSKDPTRLKLLPSE
jgi:hypothetical protein